MLPGGKEQLALHYHGILQSWRPLLEDREALEDGKAF